MMTSRDKEMIEARQALSKRITQVLDDRWPVAGKIEAAINDYIDTFVSVERILAALEEIDHRIAEQLEENVLFTGEDDAGRRDYAIALHAVLTR